MIDSGTIHQQPNLRARKRVTDHDALFFAHLRLAVKLHSSARMLQRNSCFTWTTGSRRRA